MPRWSRALTVVASLALGAMLVAGGWKVWKAEDATPVGPDALERFDALIAHEPIDEPLRPTVIRQADRYLAAVIASASRPGHGHDGARVAGAAARLAVVRGEAGRAVEAEAEAKRSGGGALFEHVIYCAYGGGDCPGLFAPDQHAATLAAARARAGLWAGSRASLTAASVAKLPDARRLILDESNRLLEPARRWAGRVAVLSFVLIGIGLLAALALRAPRVPGPAPAPPVAAAVPPDAPWTGGDLYAVLVRCGFWAVLASLVTGVALWFARPSLVAPSITVVPYVVGLVFLARLAFTRFGLDWRDAFRVPPSAAGTLLLTALAALGLDHAGRMIVGVATSHFTDGLAWSDLPSVLDRSSRLASVIVVAGTVLLAPLCEELAFRRVILSFLWKRWGGARAVATSAAIFGLLHFYTPVGTAMIAWAGLVYGWAFYRTRSLWPGVAAHAASNALAILASL